MGRIFFYLSLIVVIGACDVESSELGSNFFSESSVDVAFLDSVTVKLSTVKFDSLTTSSTTRVLIGSHDDERLGITKASCFAQLAPPTTTSLDETNTIYEYLALFIKYDKYSYYDTLSPIKLNVHSVTEKMQVDLNTGYLYNVDKFDIDPTPLGSLSFAPRPHRDDSVLIKLSDTMGAELYQLLIDQSEILKTSTEFLKHYNGIAIIPDTTQSGPLIGASTIELRLYYIDKSVTNNDDKEKYVSFPVSTSLRFSRITSDRTATKLTGLATIKDKVPSSVTDNEAYLQAGVGLALRVDMPYLRNLQQLENVYIIKAELQLYPVKQTFDKVTPIPTQLSVYSVNELNGSAAQYSTPATFIRDIDSRIDNYYTLNVLPFIRQQMVLQDDSKDGLLFTTTDEAFRTSADRIYFASTKANYKTRLKIYFASIND